MKCKTCAHTMQPLFTSTYCPRCEGGHLYDGWVVTPPPDTTLPYRAYVFRTCEHAEEWARLRSSGRDVRRVQSYAPFSWRAGVGSTEHLQFHHELCVVHLSADHERIAGHVHF